MFYRQSILSVLWLRFHQSDTELRRSGKSFRDEWELQVNTDSKHPPTFASSLFYSIDECSCGVIQYD